MLPPIGRRKNNDIPLVNSLTPLPIGNDDPLSIQPVCLFKIQSSWATSILSSTTVQRPLREHPNEANGYMMMCKL